MRLLRWGQGLTAEQRDALPEWARGIAGLHVPEPGRRPFCAHCGIRLPCYDLDVLTVLADALLALQDVIDVMDDANALYARKGHLCLFCDAYQIDEAQSVQHCVDCGLMDARQALAKLRGG